MQIKKKGKGIVVCRQHSTENQSHKNTKNDYYTCNYMKNKYKNSNFPTGRYGSKFNKKCTDNVRNSQHPTDSGVGGEFIHNEKSAKKTIPPAEKRKSKSQKFTLIPENDNSSLHSAETTHSDTNSEADDDNNLQSEGNNSQHSEDDKQNRSATGERKKLRTRKRRKYEVQLLSQALQLDKNSHMMYIPLTFDKTDCQGLLDT